MAVWILNGTLVTPRETVVGRPLVIENGKVVRLASGRESPPPGAEVLDARGCWVAPGLIDLHVHGSAGYDTMDASQQAVHGMARFFARHGVTAYLPTTAAAPSDVLRASLHTLAACDPPPDGARHLGAHIEGPYLNAAFRGAQPEPSLRDADPAEYEEWFSSGQVRLMTVAPERPGVMDLIRRGREAGVEFAIGHSQATYEQVLQAVDLGLRQATHTFNGMPPLHHRTPGVVGAVLTDDRIYAQVIADGVHLHPAVVKLIIRAKGPGRVLLITDAIRAAGLADGEYTLAGEPITVRDGICRTAQGSLAGSTLTLETAVRNVISFAGVSLAEALTMATETPAEAMGWSGRKGILAPGADADLIFLDADLNVRLTMIAGKVVYRAA